MKLDNKIKEGKRPLGCFDTEEAKQFIGQYVLFAEALFNFTDLDSDYLWQHKLVGIDQDSEYPYLTEDGDEDEIDTYSYDFILPVVWIKDEYLTPIIEQSKQTSEDDEE